VSQHQTLTDSYAKPFSDFEWTYYQQKVATALARLDLYCRRESYKGWDNYDGLKSVLFRNSPLYSSAIARLLWIQLFKRAPINLRPWVGIPKTYNAKGLALFISGLVQLGRISEAEDLLRILKASRCPGYDNVCWGYNFDWQARGTLTPEGVPNTIATVFAAHALLDCYDHTANSEYLTNALSGCDFCLNTLLLYEDRDSLCIGYLPDVRKRVHNANMLAASALARASAITRDSYRLEKSRKAMLYSCRALTSDSSWPYGEAPHQGFIDNFHTGYNLVALARWMHYTDDCRFQQQLNSAYRYFVNTFWLPNGCPKYYDRSLFPIDIHCCAQGIVTCIEAGGGSIDELQRACRIAAWAIDHMQDDTGYFYYQRRRLYTNRIPYMRWSQAWMFYSLACLHAQLERFTAAHPMTTFSARLQRRSV
jgi:hypothetical protein